MFSILGNATFRHLFGAQVFSLMGSGLATVALALLAFDLAGDRAGTVLGTAFALKMVAYVGISPVVGAYAARFPRRGFLVGLDLCRAAMVCLLPFVDAIWQVYVLVFLFQSFSAAFTPTFQATIPDVLPDEEEYTRALSLSRLAYDLESVLSPVFAGLLLSVVSFHWLFAGTGVGFLISALLVVTAALPAAKKALDQQDTLRKRLGKGFRIYMKTPRLKGLLGMSFAVSAAGSIVLVNTVVLVQGQLGADQTILTLFMGVYGAGSMVVAFTIPRLLRTVHDRKVMLAGIPMLIVGLLLATEIDSVVTGLPVWFLLGVAGSVILTPSGRLLARSAHPEDRPAIYAAHFALSHAGWLITYPLAGWAGVTFGLQETMLIMAALVLVGGVAALWFWPREFGRELEHEHPAHHHGHMHVHDEHHDHKHEGWEGPEPHVHPHHHEAVRHVHDFVIDDHHPAWPTRL
ncbi:MFS transporter [Kiloniella sp. b19]|uniref:MFS transporter n=1 Tax=Kiloniella sp. GXU_MW_B19 TaxID=3141326 RepID=UPI0031DC0B38